MPVIASRTACMPSFGQQDQLRCCHRRLSSASNGFDSSNDGIGGVALSQTNGFVPVQRDADGQASGMTITTEPRGSTVSCAYSIMCGSALRLACACSTTGSMLFSAVVNGLPSRPPRQLHANGTSDQHGLAAALSGEWSPSPPSGKPASLDFLRKPSGLILLLCALVRKREASVAIMSCLLAIVRWWHWVKPHIQRRMVLVLLLCGCTAEHSKSACGHPCCRQPAAQLAAGI